MAPGCGTVDRFLMRSAMREAEPIEITPEKGFIPKSAKACSDDGVDLTLIRWMLEDEGMKCHTD
jgi:hypothetical protein